MEIKTIGLRTLSDYSTIRGLESKEDYNELYRLIEVETKTEIGEVVIEKIPIESSGKDEYFIEISIVNQSLPDLVDKMRSSLKKLYEKFTGNEILFGKDIYYFIVSDNVKWTTLNKIVAD